MKLRTLTLPFVLAAVLSPFAWSALRSSRAASAAWEPAAWEPAAWEYKAVGFADRHADALGSLVQALTGEGGAEEEGLLEKAMTVEDRLTQQMEDMLNTYGAEGWELVHVGPHRMVFKRPAE